MKKMDDENLDKVNGGLIFNAKDIKGSDPDYHWELIDDNTGNVMGRYKSYDKAAQDAVETGRSTEITDWERLTGLRDRKK